MKKTSLLLIPATLLMLLVVSCSALSPTPEPAAPTETPDVNATVNAAVAETDIAQENMQATIDAAVDATVTANPTPITEEYVQMTEEELAALIDSAVQEATAASQEYAATTQDATADNTVTQEEITYVYPYYYAADEAIAYADELIQAYMFYYGDLAYETLELLYLVEEDLSTMAATTQALYIEMQQIEAAIQAGMTIDEEDIIKLVNAAQTLQANNEQTQTQIEQLQETVQNEIKNRTETILNIQADSIPEDRIAAIQSGFTYLDTVVTALNDDKISLDELNQIAQLGANAAVGLSQFGGPELQNLSETISGQGGITANLAQGQNQIARDNLGNLESALGDRPQPSIDRDREAPSRPDGPLINK